MKRPKIIRACTVPMSVIFVTGMLPELQERYEGILDDIFRFTIPSGSPVKTPDQGYEFAPDPIGKGYEFLLRHNRLPYNGSKNGQKVNKFFLCFFS